MLIWNYNISIFWQFFDSVPKELRWVDSQKLMKPFFEALFCCQLYSSEVVLQRSEEMVGTRADKRSCNMRSSVIKIEKYCLVFSRKFRKFFGNYLLQVDDLWSIAFPINSFTRFKKLIQPAVLSSPNTEHYHYLDIMDIRLWCWFGWLVRFYIWFFCI